MTEHDVARFLNCCVWELPDVPEHYIKEAQVIIAARRGAYMHIAKEMGGMMPTFTLDLIG